MRALRFVLATVLAVPALGAQSGQQAGIEVTGPEPGVVQLGGSSRVDIRIETKTPPKPQAVPSSRRLPSAMRLS